MSALVVAQSEQTALTLAVWAVDALRNSDPLAGSLLRFAADAAEAGARARTAAAAEPASVEATTPGTVKPRATQRTQRYTRRTERQAAA